MAIYTVREKHQALTYLIEATNMVIMNGGTLTFWSETKMIRAINSNCWELVILTEEERKGGA